MAYWEKVLEDYESPNIGSMDSVDKSVGTGIVDPQNPEWGDLIKLQIKVDENEKIIDAKFKSFGCGDAIASTSLAWILIESFQILTDWINGKSLDEASLIQDDDLMKEFPLSQRQCFKLTVDAVRITIHDYKRKNGFL